MEPVRVRVLGSLRLGDDDAAQPRSARLRKLFAVLLAVVRMPQQSDVVRRETFAPILYVLTYSTFEEALELHNSVAQGLSSSIFNTDQREAERFLAADGADCGIVNVNIGTSTAGGVHGHAGASAS